MLRSQLFRPQLVGGEVVENQEMFRPQLFRPQLAERKSSTESGNALRSVVFNKTWSKALGLPLKISPLLSISTLS